jgi:hypothetical protein
MPSLKQVARLQPGSSVPGGQNEPVAHFNERPGSEAGRVGILLGSFIFFLMFFWPRKPGLQTRYFMDGHKSQTCAIGADVRHIGFPGLAETGFVRPSNKKTSPGLVLLRDAERGGFEPPVRLPAQRFSRPPRSTALASLLAANIHKYGAISPLPAKNGPRSPGPDGPCGFRACAT